MVSIYEKHFIDTLACGNESKKHESSDTSDPDNANENHHLDSTYHTSLIFRKDYHLKSLYVSANNNPSQLERENINSSMNHQCSSYSESSNRSMPKRKKIIWNELVINQINSTLIESSVNSSTISSNTDIKKKDLMETADELSRKVYNRSFNNPDKSKKEHCSESKNYLFLEKNSVNIIDNKQYQWKNTRNFSSKIYERFGYLQEPYKALKKQNHISSLFGFRRRNDPDRIIDSVSQRSHQFDEWIKINQPKVALLGDSHTRLLDDIIAKMIPGFKVDATVMPGAKSKQVISSLKEILVNMTNNDFVIIITGTNDMWSESLEEAKAVMYNAVHSSAHTNMILGGVPNNYLEPANSPVQENILNFNQYYEDITNFKNATYFVNLYELKDRSLFTRHGLHFNHNGKIKICEMVTNKILDILESL